jgi:class 3 adenylate cyclase
MAAVDWVRSFAHAGALEGDSEGDRLRKASLLLTSSAIVLLATVWVATYWLLGLPRAAAIPFGYQIFSVASIIYFLRTKRYQFFQSGQLLLMLLLPFLLQWALGGFVSSSAVMLWAVLAPIGALVYGDVRTSIWWLLAFTALTVISGLLEGRLPVPDPPIPMVISVAFFVLNLGTVSAVAFFLLRYFVGERERILDDLRVQHRLLEVEQEKSERLLLNVLPKPIAERLKSGEEVIADGIDEVSVLFADIVGFTPFAEKLLPEDVVKLLNETFSTFDRFADEAGLEKIKTIGDAYMVAGGLPNPRPDHAEAIAKMAIRMRDSVAELAGESGPMAVRIGIDSGPVVAGVIGRRKFSYDLWGDTVNTASRMESHGVPGKIQVTPRVFERLKGRAEFEERGPVDIKGKGTMSSYFLIGWKSAS